MNTACALLEHMPDPSLCIKRWEQFLNHLLSPSPSCLQGRSTRAGFCIHSIYVYITRSIYPCIAKTHSQGKLLWILQFSGWVSGLSFFFFSGKLNRRKIKKKAQPQQSRTCHAIWIIIATNSLPWINGEAYLSNTYKMSVSLLTHRGMSRQRKSRKFTYSLLSPGIFPCLLLLIPSLPPIASLPCSGFLFSFWNVSGW